MWHNRCNYQGMTTNCRQSLLRQLSVLILFIGMPFFVETASANSCLVWVTDEFIPSVYREKQQSSRLREFWQGLRKPVVNLSRQQWWELNQWNKKYSYPKGEKPIFLHEHLPYLLEGLSPEIISEIFTEKGRLLKAKAMYRRLEAMNLDFMANPVLYSMVGFRPRQGGLNTDPVAHLITVASRQFSADERTEIIKEVQERIEEAHHEGVLSNRETAEYEIIVEGSRVIFPDGYSYKIKRRRFDGRLLIEVPKENVVKTQGYLDLNIVMKKAASGKAHKKIFDTSSWLPDGRLMLLDGHHSFSAAPGDFIRAHITPDKNGRYYSLPHISPLIFFMYWNAVPEDIKEEIFKKAEESPADAIRPLYQTYYPSLEPPKE